MEGIASVFCWIKLGAVKSARGLRISATFVSGSSSDWSSDSKVSPAQKSSANEYGVLNVKNTKRHKKKVNMFRDFFMFFFYYHPPLKARGMRKTMKKYHS
jgi:hypothetical protein